MKFNYLKRGYSSYSRITSFLAFHKSWNVNIVFFLYCFYFLFRPAQQRNIRFGHFRLLVKFFIKNWHFASYSCLLDDSVSFRLFRRSMLKEFFYYIYKALFFKVIVLPKVRRAICVLSVKGKLHVGNFFKILIHLHIIPGLLRVII